MRKQPQHNLTFGLNNPAKKPSQIVRIYLFYSYGSKNRKKRGTIIKVEARYWDNIKRELKKGYPLYNQDSLTLTEYKKRCFECLPKLVKGKMLPQTALEEC